MSNTPKWMDPSKIKYLTIHCAATPEGRDVKAETVSQWDIAKFGQVSYHHVIELDGTVVRTLQDNQVGAHTGGKNTGNIGICYIGGVDKLNKKAKDTRTPQQKVALAKIVKQYLDKYPNLIIKGHRDWPNVKKDCPSFEVARFMKEEYEELLVEKSEVEHTPPPPPKKADFSNVKFRGSTYNALTGKTEKWGDWND